MPAFSPTGDPMNPTLGIPGAVLSAFKGLVPPPQTRVAESGPVASKGSFWDRFKKPEPMVFPSTKEALAPTLEKSRLEQGMLEKQSLGQKLWRVPSTINQSEQERAAMIAAPLNSPYAEVAQAKNDVVIGAIGEAEAAPLKGVAKAAKGVVKTGVSKAMAIADKVMAEAPLQKKLFQPPKGYDLVKVRVSDIIPSQAGEDFVNKSSRETAKRISEFDITSKLDDAMWRYEDVAPIKLNEKNLIEDGNHRTAAAMMNGDEYIYAFRKRVGP